MQQKNVLTAILISFVFLGLWYSYVVPRFAPPPAPATSAPATPTASTISSPSEAADRATPVRAAPAARASVDTVLRNPQNDVVLTSVGGAVRHWNLEMKGQPMDLVRAPDEEPLPLATFPDVRFNAKVTGESIALTGDLGNGVHLTKTLALSPRGFLQNLTLEFRNPTAHSVTLRDWEIGWGPGIGTTPSEEKENSRTTRVISMGALHAHALKPGEYDAGQWAAIDNRYFMVALIPPPSAHPRLVVSGTGEKARLTLRDTTEVPAHGTVLLRYELYAGPKGYTQLKHYGKHLEEGVDFGFFSAFGKPLLSAIYQLQRLTGNYGWAIVVLTFLLQLLLTPLTLKSYRSMMVMRKIQPEMKAVQERYKGDPKRQQIEVLNLYKKHGANPMSGCLPMFLQIPIFYAFFTMLRNAYELRGAPWILWVNDLSTADRFHALPIASGVLIYLSQRVSGPVTDPTQKQMMIMSPLMMTFFFWSAPSGLSLYLVTSTLCSFAIQWFIYRSSLQTADNRPLK